jgi:hypothetical protein
MTRKWLARISQSEPKHWTSLWNSIIFQSISVEISNSLIKIQHCLNENEWFYKISTKIYSGPFKCFNSIISRKNSHCLLLQASLFPKKNYFHVFSCKFSQLNKKCIEIFRKHRIKKYSNFTNLLWTNNFLTLHLSTYWLYTHRGANYGNSKNIFHIHYNPYILTNQLP